VDYVDSGDRSPLNLPAAVSQLQMAALDRLMSGNTAKRLLDLPLYVSDKQKKGLISLNEVYGTLQSSIWSELKGTGDIGSLRRNLQREHLKRLQTLLTRGSSSLPPDALSLLRLHATELQGALRTASGASHSVETRAHLAECLGILTEALRATMQRS
ncbi:MAG TPA: metallopeptidase, partial [Burkholderiaceae bacterium]